MPAARFAMFYVIYIPIPASKTQGNTWCSRADTKDINKGSQGRGGERRGLRAPEMWHPSHSGARMLPSSTLYLTQSPYGPTMRRISCTANGKVRHSLFIFGLGKECYSCYVLHLLSRLLPHTQAKQHASPHLPQQADRISTAPRQSIWRRLALCCKFAERLGEVSRPNYQTSIGCETCHKLAIRRNCHSTDAPCPCCQLLAGICIYAANAIACR